ncbi:MAG: hypothetical protein RL026_2801 [Pseudomonadota bacterium]|jgi:hypothetical protein
MLALLTGHSRWAWEAGEFAFARGWPAWWAAVALAGAAALLLSGLWRQRQLPVRRWLVLAVLQWLFIAVLLALAWRPVLRVEQLRDQDNVVAVLLDVSASMQGPDARLAQGVAALQAGPAAALAARTDLHWYAFGGRVQPLEGSTPLPAAEPRTALGEALQGVFQTAAGQPLAAVVLLSDGADNGSALDEAGFARLAAAGIPVHAIGLGPPAPVDDLEVMAVTLPGTAYAGEPLQAEVTLHHQEQGRAYLRITDGERLLAAAELALPRRAGVSTHRLAFDAGPVGVRDLRVEVDAAPREVLLDNNRRFAVLEVTDSRRSVLYVEGEPRWEYKFIRRAVDGDPALRLASAVRATPNRWYRQGLQSADELPDGFPRDAAVLAGYDAVVLGSLDAATLDAAQHRALLDYVDRRGGSLLLLAGRDGLASGGWGRAPVAAALPARLDAGGALVAATAGVRPTVYGAALPLGRFDLDPARNAAAWQGLPPLADLQPLGALRPGAVVLLEALHAGQPEPLLVQQRYGLGSTWLLGTASTWRWQMRLPHEDLRHERFWRQLLRQVSAGTPPPVSLRPATSVLDDDERLPVEASVRDPLFRPLPGVQARLRITPPAGDPVEVPLQASGRDDGRFLGDALLSGTGLHRLELRLTQAGRELPETATRYVRHDAGRREAFGNHQHVAMLQRIAATTGGRYWSPDALADLPEAIRYSRAGTVDRQLHELWNMPAAFLLLLLLKGGEWLLRRHWGRL